MGLVKKIWQPQICGKGSNKSKLYSGIHFRLLYKT